MFPRYSADDWSPSLNCAEQGTLERVTEEHLEPSALADELAISKRSLTVKGAVSTVEASLPLGARLLDQPGKPVARPIR
jgi:hypothetical protein